MLCISTITGVQCSVDALIPLKKISGCRWQKMPQRTPYIAMEPLLRLHYDLNYLHAVGMTPKLNA